MTFNRRLKLQEFQIALQCATKDPYKLAKTIQVIPSAASSNSTKNKNYSNSNEISGCYDEHGTDWSNIVAIWLDALEASENVRCFLIVGC